MMQRRVYLWNVGTKEVTAVPVDDRQHPGLEPKNWRLCSYKLYRQIRKMNASKNAAIVDEIMGEIADYTERMLTP